MAGKALAAPPHCHWLVHQSPEHLLTSNRPPADPVTLAWPISRSISDDAAVNMTRNWKGINIWTPPAAAHDSACLALWMSCNPHSERVPSLHRRGLASIIRRMSGLAC